MTGAIIGAGVLGAGASVYSADKASSAADSASSAQSAASAAQLAFNKQQYEDWKSIYGPVQENLAGYYNRLTPDTYEALGVQNVQAEYQKALENVNQNLAQRGIDVSGISAQAEISMAQQAASQKAQVRAQAPQAVANEQAKFLGLGLGNQGALQGNISNSYGNMASQANQQWQIANQQANQAYGALGNVAGSTLSTYMQYQAMQNASPKATTAAPATQTVIPVNSGLPIA